MMVSGGLGAGHGYVVVQDGVVCRLPPDHQDLAVSIGADVRSATLEIPRGTRRIQLTGAFAETRIEVIGESGFSAELYASEPKAIEALVVRGLSIILRNLNPRRLRLGCAEDGAASASAEIATGSVLEEVFAEGGLRVAGTGHAFVMLTLLGEDRSGVGTSRERPTLAIGTLSAPQITLQDGVDVEVGQWQGTLDSRTVACAVGQNGRLTFTGSFPVAGTDFDFASGTLVLCSVALRGAKGRIGTIELMGASVLLGDSLKVERIRDAAGAEIGGVLPGALDLKSLAACEAAATFDVAIPKSSWKDFTADLDTGDWWSEPSSWRQLYSLLGQKGHPTSARWARKMEREARRTRAGIFSTERVALEAARLLGYGELVLRPLVVHTFVVGLCVLILWLSSAVPSDISLSAILTYVARLFFAPIGLVSGATFVPTTGDSLGQSVAWLVCALVGSVCFGTTVLAVRRTLAYE